MKRNLFTRLIVPLALVSAVSVLLNFVWKADGFFLNLATELVGILITVCYVDWVLSEHERENWQQADTRIAQRLRVLLNSVVSSIRGGLKIGPEVIMESAAYVGAASVFDATAMHNEVIRVAEHVIAPSVRRRVSSLDEAGWKSLGMQIGQVHNAVLSFLNAFQSRLSPDQICHLLDIQEGLSKSLVFYSTFPDIMGVPVDQLPETRTPAEDLQHFGCQSTADELEKVLAIAVQLSKTIDGP